MGGPAIASATGESAELLPSQMGSEVGFGVGHQGYRRTVSVGSTVSYEERSAPSPVEGVRHWEDIAEITSESETRGTHSGACDSDGTPPHEPRGVDTSSFMSPCSPPDAIDSGAATMKQSSDSQPLDADVARCNPADVGQAEPSGDPSERSLRNVFQRSSAATEQCAEVATVPGHVPHTSAASSYMHGASAAEQYTCMVHSGGGSVSSAVSSAIGAGAGVATSADIAARQAPLLHAPAMSPPCIHGAAPPHYAAAPETAHGSGMHADYSSEDSLTLME